MATSAARWILLAASLVAAGVVSATSCGSDSRSLSVDLRTDLVPSDEFVKVVTQIEGGAPVEHAAAATASAYLAGLRVADFASLEEGSVRVEVKLLDGEGGEIVTRQSRVTLTEDYALTVVVTRNCAGVVCPEPEGDPSLSTCHAGKCVSPDCTVDAPELCGGVECDENADCRSEHPCLAPQCARGVCLFPPDDALCKEGEICDPSAGCRSIDGEPECTPKGTTEASCSDGADDDCDGRVDCLDEDCGGLGCEDGDACTTGETCADGTCAGGSATSCDDGNDCTDDSCDPKAGCAHPEREGACEDGDACTTGDTCQAGMCVPGAAAACDDGNPCTDDACDPAAGCTTADNALACDDGLFCNGADTCGGGSCSVHAGSQCAELCNEATDSCAGCLVDADCGAPTFTAWGICKDFASFCDEGGIQERTKTTYACVGGTCKGTAAIEKQPCSRDRKGLKCKDPLIPNWGACGGFSDACDKTGTQSRTVTTYACGGGQCVATNTKKTQSCTRSVANGKSCGTNRYCCGGNCVSKGSSNNCGVCGMVCAGGFSCGSPQAGQFGCRCSTDSQCVNGGYGTGATCYTTGAGSFCNCQCGSGTTCTNKCKGGTVCHDVPGQNYCSY